MERFDFDTLTQRRGTSSMKWDGEGDPEDVIPLWVADMDFRTAPAVTEALMRRVESGIFGYTDVPTSYYEALTEWFRSRHGWIIPRRNVIYTSGVVPAISAIIKALTRPGDGVILQTPAYNCFFSSIRNNGCMLAPNPLRRVAKEGGFSYEIDFEGLERLASDPRNRLLILCNPHNPSGRVWTREELMRLRNICTCQGVRVVSDEIHCELVHPGQGPYVPYATVDPEAVVCCSPSKAFNTAGLQIANIVCPSAEVRISVDRAINDNEVCDVNPFGVIGLEAAYRHGGEWLDALNDYLYANYLYLRDEFAKSLPALTFCDSQATYLAWVDITATGLDSERVAEILLDKARVRVSPGEHYHDGSCIRINYACPRERLREAVERMIPVLSALL